MITEWLGPIQRAVRGKLIDPRADSSKEALTDRAPMNRSIGDDCNDATLIIIA